MKTFLICLSGIDGTGKTTIALSLFKSLKNRVPRIKYRYCRYIPLLLRPISILARFIFVKNVGIYTDYVKYLNKKHIAILKYPFFSKLYIKLILFDYTLQLFFKVTIPLLLGFSLICDRYIYDTVITDISVDFNYSAEKISKKINKMFKFFRKPDVSIIIDLDENIAFLRKNDTLSINYLKTRRKKYLELTKYFEIFVLDGAKKVDELIFEIKSILKRKDIFYG